MNRVVRTVVVCLFFSTLFGVVSPLHSAEEKEGEKKIFGPQDKPTPEATPRKRNIFERLFFGPRDSEKIDESKIKRAVPVEEGEKKSEKEENKKEKPEPTPKPKATPKPKSTPKPEPTPKSTPKPESTPKPTPEKTPKPTPKPTPTPEARKTDKPAEKGDSAKPKPSPEGGSFSETPAFVPEPTLGSVSVSDIVSEDYEAKQKARFEKLKQAALKNEKVAALKEKAESAPPGKEKESLKAYYSALFDKMRELDKSMVKRIDLMEKATERRINRL